MARELRYLDRLIQPLPRPRDAPKRAVGAGHSRFVAEPDHHRRHDMAITVDRDGGAAGTLLFIGGYVRLAEASLHCPMAGPDPEQDVFEMACHVRERPGPAV